MDIGKEKVRCPYCGHPVNANRSADAVCKGVFFKCKNKECRKVFELRIEDAVPMCLSYKKGR